MTKTEFFCLAIPAAYASHVVWPDYMVCIAALESGWGTSKLTELTNNILGIKAGKGKFPLISMNTHEVIHGRDVVVPASWPVFPNWQACFAEAQAMMERMPLYADSLKCTNGEDFVREMSKHWSTDPNKARKVLTIFIANEPLIDDIKAHAATTKAQVDAPTNQNFETPTVDEAIASIPKPKIL